MITSNPKNDSIGQQILKVLVLMVGCFNLFGFFLLFYPQFFSPSVEVESIGEN